mmetsp:Transcript_3647/g.10485  ORF Transcript_3647/g.10485 Transcript_3647/m.10485 type:complete len:952 (-) Transcript_3647:137-2992(-)|eukprot:CAMPEP_0117664632 /NCGR_PEP_ID=MMETSP0804-20121206/9335_1 /TAXON_ID=1074897 /ORGANISM="Tetraselmis astigmatica, Strain CCMP880" /LENGTH=951 /DNA_ID=CAMNT_0005471901 /DNA_START=556 /DNA_END=3411 /DNA_ORIENTATION=-
MIVDKPHWVTHGGSQIFGVHVSSDGARLATAGGDNKVKIWSMEPILSAEAEASRKPKLLATLLAHYGPVNAVRFSPNGAYVASSADDSLVCIHEHKADTEEPMYMFGTDDPPNVENWSQSFALRGHASCVMDVAWSPDGCLLASCSLDNKVIVWDSSTGGKAATLTAHSSCVKGAAWDPIGRYLATQGDDKAVVVWKVEDWTQVSRIDDCYSKGTCSTFSLRLCWSRDGGILFTPNVHEPPCQCAAAIARGKWSSDYKLVGHKAPVVVCATNPKFFMQKPAASENGSKASAEVSASHCIALGSQDKQLSVWKTTQAQPVMIMKSMFDAAVNDLAWTPDGYTLVAASIDGSIAVFTMDESELGIPVPQQQVDELLATLYGEAPGMRHASKLLESAEHLALEAAIQDSPLVRDGPPSAAADGKSKSTKLPTVQRPPPPTFSAPDRVKAAAPSQRPSSTAALQKESRTKDGRRRVAPVQVAGSPSSKALQSDGERLLAGHESTPAAGVISLQSPAALPDGEGIGTWQPEMSSAGHSACGLRPALLRSSLEVDLPGPHGEAQGEGATGDLASASQGAAGSPGTKTLTVSNHKKHGATLSCLGADNAEASISNSQHKPFVLWTVSLPFPCLFLDAGSSFIAAALTNSSVQVFSPAGRLLLPPLALSSPAAHLKVFDRKLLVAAGRTVHLWDVGQQALMCEAELGPVFAMAGGKHRVVDMDLSSKGEPVVILSNRSAYLLHSGMRAWMHVADDRFPSTPFHSTEASSRCRGALATLSKRLAHGAASSAQRASAMLSRSAGQAWEELRCHQEANVAAAKALGDGAGYRRALRMYCKQLAETGDEGRLREVFTDLLGPLELNPADAMEDGAAALSLAGVTEGLPKGPDDTSSSWEPRIMGQVKLEMLREVLPCCAASRCVPGLVSEFQGMLKELDAGQACLPLSSSAIGGAAGPPKHQL